MPVVPRNRTLHIRWYEDKRQPDVSDGAKRQNDVLETPLHINAHLSLKEPAVIKTIHDFIFCHRCNYYHGDKINNFVVVAGGSSLPEASRRCIANMGGGCAYSNSRS